MDWTMNIRKSVILTLFAMMLITYVQAEAPTDQDKAADLAKAFKDADVVFTATIGKVQPMGHTNNILITAFGKVTFKDLKALRGALPEVATFSYSCTDGVTLNFDLSLQGQVIVAAKQKGVIAIVPSTDPNLALANKRGEGDK
jgi:H2-forming N5,N10-methylenetetrahydromethanopterin dehydrogenase-like enzyme